LGLDWKRLTVVWASLSITVSVTPLSIRPCSWVLTLVDPHTFPDSKIE
jgi:hypothetical protein